MHSVHKTWAIATYGVAWSVCLLVTFVSFTETAKPMEMPIPGLTQVGP